MPEVKTFQFLLFRGKWQIRWKKWKSPNSHHLAWNQRLLIAPFKCVTLSLRLTIKGTFVHGCKKLFKITQQSKHPRGRGESMTSAKKIEEIGAIVRRHLLRRDFFSLLHGPLISLCSLKKTIPESQIYWLQVGNELIFTNCDISGNNLPEFFLRHCL